jgi:hypothetical protein
MTWVAAGVGVAGIASSAIGGSKSRKSADKAAQKSLDAQKEAAAYQQMWGQQNQQRANEMNIANTGTEQEMNKQNLGWANDLNRQNQEWAQGLNQQAIQDQIGQNRLSGTNAMGTSMGFDENGNYTQTLGEGDQALMDTLRGKSNEIMQGMGGGFDVNGDVMNAYKAVNQPLVDQQRNKENARLAAMGLGTGSGTAWGTAQDALNRNQVNADQNAILQGFNADQALRTSNRADLSAMGGVRQNIQAGTATPDYWKAGSAGVSAPSVSGWTSNIADVGTQGAGSVDANSALQYGQNAGQATQNQWNSIGGGIGDLAGSLMGGGSSSPTGGKGGVNPTMQQTSGAYNTMPMSQQTSMLNAQDMGMGGKK